MGSCFTLNSCGYIVSKNFIISGSSLPAKQATKASSSTRKGEEEEAEPVGVITLAVPTATKASSSTREGEEEEEEAEPVGVITLAVPTMTPTATTGTSSSADSEASDYLVTTYNSVTGYETSV